MSNTFEEACWICGQPTKNRCGACEEAGIDIFFCSREHQKLVWPVHKLVCGPGKANPFVWPGLSDEECDFVRRHLHTKIPLNESRSFSLADLLQEENLDLRLVPGFFAAYTYDTEELRQIVPWRKFQAILGMIRATDVSHEEAGTAGRSAASPAPVIAHAHNRMTLCFLPSEPPPPSDEPWWQLVLHRLLVVEALKRLAHSTEPNILHEQYYRTAHTALLDLVRKEAPPTLVGTLLRGFA